MLLFKIFLEYCKACLLRELKKKPFYVFIDFGVPENLKYHRDPSHHIFKVRKNYIRLNYLVNVLSGGKVKINN